MKKNNYNYIAENLLKAVPEFNSVFDLDDGAYPIFGEFGRYLIVSINDDNTSVVTKSFNFISLELIRGNNEIEDLIVLEIFQAIYEDVNLIKKTIKYLDKKTLSIFNESLIEYKKPLSKYYF